MLFDKFAAEFADVTEAQGLSFKTFCNMLGDKLVGEQSVETSACTICVEDGYHSRNELKRVIQTLMNLVATTDMSAARVREIGERFAADLNGLSEQEEHMFQKICLQRRNWNDSSVASHDPLFALSHPTSLDWADPSVRMKKLDKTSLGFPNEAYPVLPATERRPDNKCSCGVRPQKPIICSVCNNSYHCQCEIGFAGATPADASSPFICRQCVQLGAN